MTGTLVSGQIRAGRCPGGAAAGPDGQGPRPAGPRPSRRDRGRGPAGRGEPRRDRRGRPGPRGHALRAGGVRAHDARRRCRRPAARREGAPPRRARAVPSRHDRAARAGCRGGAAGWGRDRGRDCPGALGLRAHPLRSAGGAHARGSLHRARVFTLGDDRRRRRPRSLSAAIGHSEPRRRWRGIAVSTRPAAA